MPRAALVAAVVAVGMWATRARVIRGIVDATLAGLSDDADDPHEPASGPHS